MLQRSVVRPGLVWLVSLAVLGFAAGGWAPSALPAAYLAMIGAALITVVWGSLVVVRHHAWWLVASIVPGAVVFTLTIGFESDSETDTSVLDSSVLVSSCVIVAIFLTVGGAIGAVMRLSRR